MRHTKSLSILAAACAGVLFSAAGRAAIIINEFAYDDGSTDDREFVELYNDGAAPVDISGWTLGGIDPTTTNLTATVPASTFIPAGGYYVIGNTGVLNVNQVVAANFFENDNESLELKDPSGALQDAVVYEANKGIAFAAGLAAQIGPGYWSNNQASDVAGTPLVSSNAVGRWVDGRDTNNNGRDFGMRVATPGSSNNPVNITAYTTPDPTGGTVGAVVPGFAYSFVAPKIVDPTVADTVNPNAIAPAPSTGNRAIVAWDPTGGGNAASAAETFNTTQGKFDVKVYLDTRDLPLMFNASNVTFRGSEFTIYGLGNADALNNGVNLSGATGFTGVLQNGITGLAWVYEKVGETGTGLGDVSEKLFLVDANDGGDQGAGDWSILATIDLSSTVSGWFDLGISVDALGNGTAYFDGQVINFITSTAFHASAFSVGYRETTQLGSDGTPDAIRRPATFTVVPEPATLGLLGLASRALGRRSRR